MKNWMIAVLATALTACNGQNKQVRDWTDDEVDAWFARSEWQTTLPCKADSRTDKRQLAEQSLRNPAAWAAAAEFLKRSDLDSLALGNYPLTDDGAYASVSEYVTKDSATFEVHRRFIDIQYVRSGEEDIWVAPLNSLENCLTPYDAQKDIAFYASAPAWDVRRADASTAHILFPSDGHQPCMKVGERGPVRKIVVKIPYTE